MFQMLKKKCFERVTGSFPIIELAVEKKLAYGRSKISAHPRLNTPLQ